MWMIKKYDIYTSALTYKAHMSQVKRIETTPPVQEITIDCPRTLPTM